jgi:hypothetical protein
MQFWRAPAAFAASGLVETFEIGPVVDAPKCYKQGNRWIDNKFGRFSLS